MTLGELRRRLASYPDDAPVWVLHIDADGADLHTFHVVNTHMDRIVERAVLIVERAGSEEDESQKPMREVSTAELDRRILLAKRALREEFLS